jgi:hypothetical protein
MTKRLRQQDFPIPKKMEDDEWEAICEAFKVPSDRRQRLRMRLNDVTERLATWMSQDRKLPDRKFDGERVTKILSHINAAAAETDKLGPVARLAFKAISPFIAAMLAAQWMNERFPFNDYTPQRSPVPAESDESRPPIRTSFRTPEYFIEEHTHEARFQFVRRIPIETMEAVLKQIAEGLSEVLRTSAFQPRSRGGQEPLLYRDYALINLLDMWHEMGERPSSGPNSACTVFCESVVSALGWPTEGLSSAMPDAINHWRHLSGKSNR